MDSGSCSILMGESIKESGRTTINKARDMKSSLTRPFMMARISKENPTATENMNGKMDKFIKASGSMDSKAGPGFGEAPKVTPTLESGTTAKQKDTVSILGLMAIDTKANSKSASNMERASKNLPTVTLIAAPMKTESLMDTDNIIGATAVHTKVISKMV